MGQIPNEAQGTDAKSFQLYTGKAPLPLQIIAGLMWLGGIAMILQGIPLLILLGFGIIPITLGIFNIIYGKAIFKIRKKGYRGALFLQGIVVVISATLWGLSGFSKVNNSSLVGILYALLVGGVLYLYRDKFVNE